MFFLTWSTYICQEDSCSMIRSTLDTERKTRVEARTGEALSHPASSLFGTSQKQVIWVLFFGDTFETGWFLDPRDNGF